jgi:PAS domain-containing protein
VAVFICPRCGHRAAASERAEGHQPRGCAKCGFGFAFEIMDDYYAGPLTALITCDRERRVLVAGKSAAALTGWAEGDLIGREVSEALGLRFPDASDDPVARCLEWGVRVLGERCAFRPQRTDEDRDAVADLFPAYDDDGGLMLALTPVTKG